MNEGHGRSLTWHTLSVGVCISVTGVGVGGGAIVHTAQQRAQVAHWHLLDEGSAILPEVPPLKYLHTKDGGRRGQALRRFWRVLTLSTQATHLCSLQLHSAGFWNILTARLALEEKQAILSFTARMRASAYTKNVASAFYGYWQ